MAHGTSVNRLLQRLTAEAPPEALPRVAVELHARDVLTEPGTPALHVYFPITAVVSLVSTMESGDSTEVALVGREGMIGLAGVLGTMESPTSAIVLVSGTAMRVPTASLLTARLTRPSIRRTIDLYTEARLIQVAQGAACNRLHGVNARLARWLLGIHERIEGDEFAVSHGLIADMLGVHRPTVTTTLGRLQDKRAIVRRGRSIVIADRSRLQSLACECHQVLAGEFERLFGPVASDARTSQASAAIPGSQAEPRTTATLEAMREIAGRLLVASIREQEAREQLEAASRSKDQFLAMVSHELRNPLNAILGWCSILTSDEGQSPQRGLKIIERNARAQLKLVEDLLDAVRITSATLTIEPGPVRLPELVHHVVDAMRPAADEKGVTIGLAVMDEFPVLFGDPDRLRQALVNVVANSLKFTQTGGAVDVRLAAARGRAQVIVRDTGRGIAPGALPHVFEEFHRGSAPGSAQGLGLGLTITRALVELHGGTIVIESPGENAGTTCTIDLPLDNRSPSASPAAGAKM